MVGLGGKFPVKPEGADVRRILIAHTMRHKSVVHNGHKIKSNVLQDNCIAHKNPPFLKGNGRKSELSSLLDGPRGSERAPIAAHP
jgi:hypothetical protein